MDDRRMRAAYVWNTAGSMLNAFQSVIMLMVLTRACDLATAGIFTLAYANANLFLTLGSFGMRNFEASDVAPRYAFRTYGLSRVVTSVAMVACSWGWLAWSAAANGYTPQKVAAVAMMTLMKVVDAAEDVFDGNFQQVGRLDVAGRLMTARIATTVVAFCATAWLTRDLVVATTVGFAWGLVFLLAGLVVVRRRCGLPRTGSSGGGGDGADGAGAVDGFDPAGVKANEQPQPAPVLSPWPLLTECVPLFLAAFLSFYVGNAPKYAIDAVMSDAEQAVYGFIAMPVFVVGLLAQFVYMPLVRPMSDLWAQGRTREFRRLFVQQVGIIAAITVVCVAGAALLGPPVLGWLYATDLGPWRAELCALVAGGGLLALASLFTMGMTIIREQRRLVAGYAVAAAMAAIASGPLVDAWGIAGAAVCYVACMAVLAVWFGVLFARASGRM